MSFSLTSEFKPTGDQPKAIKSIIDSFNTNHNHVTLQGVTGSGKTFTVANVIQEIQKPTLVLAHNKTLAAQLYSEFQSFFLIMLLSTLSLIMIIISLRHIFHHQDYI